MNYVVSNGLEVSIHVDGAPLPVYLKDGVYWIAGEPGKAYNIRVEPNNAPGRVEILTSVDGRNTLKDESASYDNRGMIVNRWSTYYCQGWRIDDNRVREFVFGSPAVSIAAQATGEVKGVGVIGVAAFHERLMYLGFESTPKAMYRGATGQSILSAADLGTGMGREQHDHVGHTTFERNTFQPAAAIEIQYRPREWLVENGIIAPMSQRPSAFPGNDQTGYGKYVT